MPPWKDTLDSRFEERSGTPWAHEALLAFLEERRAQVFRDHHKLVG